MESVLIISSSKKITDFFSEMLNALHCGTIVIQQSGSDARRMLMDRDFDLVIINSPLPDETGENLSLHISMKGTEQVMLVADAEHYEEISSATENFGVITIPRPIDRNFFWTALKLIESAQSKLKRIKEENTKLVRKIDDIRIVDRAKCTLISYLGMTELEAHKYIEKRAMDMRISRRVVAEEILKTYEK